MVTESNFQEETGFLRNLCKSRGFSGTQPGFLVMVDLVCPLFLAMGPGYLVELSWCVCKDLCDEINI